MESESVFSSLGLTNQNLQITFFFSFIYFFSSHTCIHFIIPFVWASFKLKVKRADSWLDPDSLSLCLQKKQTLKSTHAKYKTVQCIILYTLHISITKVVRGCTYAYMNNGRFLALSFSRKLKTHTDCPLAHPTRTKQ